MGRITQCFTHCQVLSMVLNVHYLYGQTCLVAAVMEKTERLLMDKKWIACAFMVDKFVYNLIYFKLPIMLTNFDYILFIYFIHCLIVFCACIIKTLH